MRDQSEFKEAVANGGFLTHIKPANGHAALCGYIPSSPNANQFARGRWKETKPVEIDGKRLKWCRKCRIEYLRAIGNFQKLMTE